MKRKDLIREVRNLTRRADAELVLNEGGEHTRIEIFGRLITTVPRHREIAEGTARNILRLVEEATR